MTKKEQDVPECVQLKDTAAAPEALRTMSTYAQEIYPIPALTGHENFSAWRSAVLWNLEFLNLRGFIDGTDFAPGYTRKEQLLWRQRKKEAYDIVRSRLQPVAHFLKTTGKVRYDFDVKFAWDAEPEKIPCPKALYDGIVDAFGHPDPKKRDRTANDVALELLNLSQENCGSLDNFLMQALHLRQVLKGFGVDIDDHVMQSLIHKGIKPYDEYWCDRLMHVLPHDPGIDDRILEWMAEFIIDSAFEKLPDSVKLSSDMAKIMSKVRENVEKRNAVMKDAQRYTDKVTTEVRNVAQTMRGIIEDTRKDNKPDPSSASDGTDKTAQDIYSATSNVSETIREKPTPEGQSCVNNLFESMADVFDNLRKYRHGTCSGIATNQNMHTGTTKTYNPAALIDSNARYLAAWIGEAEKALRLASSTKVVHSVKQGIALPPNELVRLKNEALSKAEQYVEELQLGVSLLQRVAHGPEPTLEGANGTLANFKPILRDAMDQTQRALDYAASTGVIERATAVHLSQALRAGMPQTCVKEIDEPGSDNTKNTIPSSNVPANSSKTTTPTANPFANAASVKNNPNVKLVKKKNLGRNNGKGIEIIPAKKTDNKTTTTSKPVTAANPSTATTPAPSQNTSSLPKTSTVAPVSKPLAAAVSAASKVGGNVQTVKSSSTAVAGKTGTSIKTTGKKKGHEQMLKTLVKHLRDGEIAGLYETEAARQAEVDRLTLVFGDDIVEEAIDVLSQEIEEQQNEALRQAIEQRFIENVLGADGGLGLPSISKELGPVSAEEVKVIMDKVRRAYDSGLQDTDSVVGELIRTHGPDRLIQALTPIVTKIDDRKELEEMLKMGANSEAVATSSSAAAPLTKPSTSRSAADKNTKKMGGSATTPSSAAPPSVTKPIAAPTTASTTAVTTAKPSKKKDKAKPEPTAVASASSAVSAKHTSSNPHLEDILMQMGMPRTKIDQSLEFVEVMERLHVVFATVQTPKENRAAKVHHQLQELADIFGEQLVYDALGYYLLPKDNRENQRMAANQFIHVSANIAADAAECTCGKTWDKNDKGKGKEVSTTTTAAQSNPVGEPEHDKTCLRWKIKGPIPSGPLPTKEIKKRVVDEDGNESYVSVGWVAMDKNPTGKKVDGMTHIDDPELSRQLEEMEKNKAKEMQQSHSQNGVGRSDTWSSLLCPGLTPIELASEMSRVCSEFTTFHPGTAAAGLAAGGVTADTNGISPLPIALTDAQVEINEKLERERTAKEKQEFADEIKNELFQMDAKARKILAETRLYEVQQMKKILEKGDADAAWDMETNPWFESSFVRYTASKAARLQGFEEEDFAVGFATAMWAQMDGKPPTLTTILPSDRIQEYLDTEMARINAQDAIKQVVHGIKPASNVFIDGRAVAFDHTATANAPVATAGSSTKPEALIGGGAVPVGNDVELGRDLIGAMVDKSKKALGRIVKTFTPSYPGLQEVYASSTARNPDTKTAATTAASTKAATATATTSNTATPRPPNTAIFTGKGVHEVEVEASDISEDQAGILRSAYYNHMLSGADINKFPSPFCKEFREYFDKHMSKPPAPAPAPAPPPASVFSGRVPPLNTATSSRPAVDSSRPGFASAFDPHGYLTSGLFGSMSSRFNNSFSGGGMAGGMRLPFAPAPPNNTPGPTSSGTHTTNKKGGGHHSKPSLSSSEIPPPPPFRVHRTNGPGILVEVNLTPRDGGGSSSTTQPQPQQPRMPLFTETFSDMDDMERQIRDQMERRGRAQAMGDNARLASASAAAGVATRYGQTQPQSSSGQKQQQKQQQQMEDPVMDSEPEDEDEEEEDGDEDNAAAASASAPGPSGTKSSSKGKKKKSKGKKGKKGGRRR